MNFYKYKKGDAGEQKVEEILHKHLKEDFFIKRGFQIPYGTDSLEVDLLLYHPAFGMFILEVKNISNPKDISKKHFEQAKKYRNIILSALNEKLQKENLPKTKLSINFKVVYPSLEATEVPFGYENHVLFKEDLKDLKKLFLVSNNYIPSQKELEVIEDFFQINREGLPIISQDGIKYFDQKQISALNSYMGGFRLIRGIAGSGKSILLKNFANRKKDKKILLIVFNTKLFNKLKREITNKNVTFFTFFTFLGHIGIKLPENFNEKFEFIKANTALIYKKIKEFQEKEKFDYLLIDEAQDIEAGALRAFIESFENSLIFIDEAQKMNRHSIDNFYEVSRHPYFKKTLSVRGGRTIALKNIYRTPRNIAQCAIELVRKDKTISNYYKSISFVKDGFKGINFILEDGKIEIYENLDIKKILDSISDETYLILTLESDRVDELKKYFSNVYTISSVKGLEADHIIVDSFDKFLKKTSKNSYFYRQLYVLLTRAKKNIYFGIKESEEFKDVIDTIKKYQNQSSPKIKEAFIKDLPTIISEIRFMFL